MNDSQPQKEFRFKGSPTILGFIRQFSSTEKVIFGTLLLAALATMLIMVAKVNNSFLVEVPAFGGELREGAVGLPRTVNPVLAATDIDRDLSALVYAGLTRFKDGEIVPDLAKKFSISDDGLTYTFTLRTGLKWSDGQPLTTDDVAYTVQKIQDSALKSVHRNDWTNISVEVSSPTEIKFILKQPYSPFLSNTTIGIIPKHIWNKLTDDQFVLSKNNIEPIGSGPYKVSSVSYDKGGIPTTYSLTTWSGYYGAKPYLSKISFSFYSDADKALEALDSGYIDSLASISPSEAAKLATDSAQAYEILSSPMPRVFGVFFNQSQNDALSDKYVRQALDMSVNRDALINKVLKGYGVAIDSPLPATLSSSTDDIGTANVSGAQALLEKNGWKKNSSTGIYEKKSSKGAVTKLSFELFTADTEDLKQAAESVRADWQTLGADVTVKVFETSDLYQNVIRTRKYDALLFGEYIGKDRDLYAFWHSSQRNAPGLNVALYTNSKVDKLLEDIRTMNSSTARNAKYGELSKLIGADMPAVFLYMPDFIYAVPKDLKNTSLGSITLPSDRWNTVSKWYITTEKVWKIFANNQ